MESLENHYRCTQKGSPHSIASISKTLGRNHPDVNSTGWVKETVACPHNGILHHHQTNENLTAQKDVLAVLRGKNIQNIHTNIPFRSLLKGHPLPGCSQVSFSRIASPALIFSLFYFSQLCSPCDILLNSCCMSSQECYLSKLGTSCSWMIGVFLVLRGVTWHIVGAQENLSNKWMNGSPKPGS